MILLVRPDDIILSRATVYSSINFLNSYIDIFSPAYFGILDLSGEDVEVKNLFTDEEWSEMNMDIVWQHIYRQDLVA